MNNSINKARLVKYLREQVSINKASHDDANIDLCSAESARVALQALTVMILSGRFDEQLIVRKSK